MTDNSDSTNKDPGNERRASPAAAPSIGAKTPVKAPPSIRRISPEFILLKWVLIPLLLAGLLVAFGAHLGANGADQWYARSIVWIVNLLK